MLVYKCAHFHHKTPLTDPTMNKLTIGTWPTLPKCNGASTSTHAALHNNVTVLASNHPAGDGLLLPIYYGKVLLSVLTIVKKEINILIPRYKYS